MKLLITGACGYLGRGMVQFLEQHYSLRLMDIVAGETKHEMVVGDVADPEAVRAAVKGVDALVIAHMAPNRPEIYAHPALPIDVNVKGTANLFAAAVENNIKQVVLISSTGVVADYPPEAFRKTDVPHRPSNNLYSMTKVLQENIAAYYHRWHNLSVAILRPAAIQDEDTLTDKYGRRHAEASWVFADRWDIGKAAHCALQLPDLGCEVFYVMGHPDAPNHVDMEPTFTRLKWKPDHDFTKSPGSAQIQ